MQPFCAPPASHPTNHRRRGNALVALLFWIGGAVLLFAPFLRPRAGLDPEGDDPGRELSETDIPFDQDLQFFQEDYALDLAGAVEAASQKWFGEESDRLRQGGLIKTERLHAGKVAYDRYCVGCHSSTGDGAGPGARYLNPRPRNFRKGMFKFTSTQSGGVPLRKDLFSTITRGLSGSSMPDFRMLSEERRWDLVEYVRYLSVRGSFEQLMVDIAWQEEELPDADSTAEIVYDRWSDEASTAVYPPTSDPGTSPESVARGRELFQDSAGANCAGCHGEGGRGDGPAATDFTDGWGYPIQPRDLTSGVFRAGAEPADLYRSISTGVNGTPMPAYASTFETEDIWAMVHFIQSLKGNQ